MSPPSFSEPLPCRLLLRRVRSCTIPGKIRGWEVSAIQCNVLGLMVVAAAAESPGSRGEDVAAIVERGGGGWLDSKRVP